MAGLCYNETGDKRMEVRLIGVPLEAGCEIHGSCEAAHVLKQAGVSFDAVVESQPDQKTSREIVAEVCRGVKEEVLKAHDAGRFPLVIGGDHALAIGSLAATIQVQLLHVVWIDAHTDINTPEASLTKRIHGMPVAAAMGEGYPELVELMEEERLGVDDITYLGIRSMDPFEASTIREAGIKMHTYDAIRQEGLANVLDGMEETIDVPVHISLDLDSMAPTVCPGVNTPVADGFTWEDIIDILDVLFDTYDVVSMDIVEFNPLHDVDEKSRNMVCELISYVKHRVAAITREEMK